MSSNKGKEMSPSEREIIIKFKNEGKLYADIASLLGRKRATI